MMIRNKSISLILFSILSLITMVGCGGSATTPQSKTTTPPTPAAAVVFQGNFEMKFTDSSGPDAMDVQIAFNQAETNITGHGVLHTAGYSRSQLNASCIDLENVSVTGTIQGSSFALILTDPSRQTANISGTISPLQGNYNISFPASCGYGSSMTGTVSFQKVGA